MGRCERCGCSYRGWNHKVTYRGRADDWWDREICLCCVLELNTERGRKNDKG